MSQVPVKTSSEVEVEGLTNPFQAPPRIDVSPVAEAASQGEALARQQAMHQREINAQFAADDADLKLAGQVGQLKSEFNDLKGLEPNKALAEYKTKLLEAREADARGLKDPLAIMRYNASSRRRVENHLEWMEMHASTQLTGYQKQVADGRLADSLDQARTYYSRPDKLSDAVHQAIDASEAFYGKVMHEPEDMLNRRAFNIAKAVTVTALGEAVGSAVDDPTATKAGLDLLHGSVKMGDQDVKVVDLLGDSAKTWERKLMGAHKDATAVTLGVDLYEKYGGSSGAAQHDLDEQLKAGTIDQETYAKSFKQYGSVVETRDTLRDRADSQLFKGAGDNLAKVGFDIEQYKAKFHKEWDALGGDQAKLQLLADSASRRGMDPDQEQAYSKLVDLVSVPGWSDQKTYEQIFREWGPVVGLAHMKEVESAYRADKGRPADQDGSSSAIMGILDTNLRSRFQFVREYGNNVAWEAIDDDAALSARNWAVAQVTHMISAHHDDTRKKGAAAQDPNWFLKNVDAIVRAADTMRKTGKMPVTPEFNQPRQGRAAPPPTGGPRDGEVFTGPQLGFPEGTEFRFNAATNQYDRLK